MSNKKILVILLAIFFISMINVNAFDLTSTVNERGACAGSTLLFNALLSGAGSFTVNVDGEASSWAVAVPNSFTLNNEVKTLYVYATPKSSTSPGLYNLNLVVTATTGEVKTINYKINVLDCHKVSIQGPEIKDVCGCDVERYDFIVGNEGQFQEFYKLSVGGSAADFATLSQDTLLLNPGESKDFFVYLTAPCSNFGEYDFTLSAISETSNAATGFDSQVNIKNCFEFEVSPDKDFISLCEHSVEELPIRISNKAENFNNFNLKITGPGWANLENNDIALAPLKKGEVNLVLSPDYRIEGMFDINLVVEGVEGKLKKERTIKAEVKKCHDVLFEIIEAEDSICHGLSKVYEVSVKNTGQFEKEYKLETSEVWARLDEGIIDLESGEEKRVNLEISPSVNLVAKKYDVYARAIALDTSKVQSEDFVDINVISNENCYKPSLKAQDLIIKQEGSATIPVVIENQGSVAANYNIGLSGTATSFSQLNPATIKVSPGKSEIVYVYTAPSLMINPGSYKAGIAVRIKDSGILASTTINIDVEQAAAVEKIPVVPKEPGLLEKIRAWLVNLLKISPVIEEVPVIIDFKEEKILSEDTSFVYKGEEHNLRILEISNDSVSLVIESSPTIVLLDLGESKEVDVDNDGINDLMLTLEAIEEGIPIIKAVEISEEIVEELPEEIEEKPIVEPEEIEEVPEEIVEELPEEVIEEVEEEEVIEEVEEETPKDFIKDVVKKLNLSGTYNKIKNLSSMYRNYIIYAIIILIILALILSIQEFGGWKGKRRTGGFGKYFAALIGIAILIWLIKRYSALIGIFLNDYVNPYRKFIIAGIIVLIILIYLISNWGKVVEFFEEEIEEEEEINKGNRNTKKKSKKKKKK